MKIKKFIFGIKIFIILFWIVSNSLLIMFVIDSSRSFLFYLTNDFMFLFFFIIGIFGILSTFLEKLYRGLMIRYFVFSFFVTSCFLFVNITLIFFGLLQPRGLKGHYLTFNDLLFHYCVNFAFFCVSLFGIYAIYKNKKKYVAICLALVVLHIVLYLFFYGAVLWHSPIEIISFWI